MTLQSAARGQILEAVERFARDDLAPRARAIDESEAFPHDLYARAAEKGLLALWVPEAYGGIGADLLTQLLAVECLARVSPTFSLIFATAGDGSAPILHGASDELKGRYLPRIADGSCLPCFALSEPGAGSDAASIRTRARREGDHYVIDGNKMWCTNGSVGRVFSIFAKTDPEAGAKGVTGFLVDRGTPGLGIGADEPLIGMRGSPTTQLHLDGLRVPAERRLGAEGEGFRVAMTSLDEARLNAAASSLGLGAAALDHALAYARERVQFGRPIIEHQGLSFLFAELASELCAARALWLQATDALQNDRSKRASTLTAMAKNVCTTFGMRATTEAVQAMGGAGLSRNHPVEMLMRDAKTFQIFDGTTQIQNIIIGRYLAREGLPL